MSQLPTKQKILQAAIRCFNRDGIANVRLQHIADEAGLSLGNMTYHYRNKETLVKAVWEQLVQMQEQLLAEFRVLPLFQDIERLITHLFKLQQEYRFFYVDMLEVMRAFPQIQAAQRQHISWQIRQMEMALQFNQSRGALRQAGSVPELQLLARQFWMTADLWMCRQQTEGGPDTEYVPFRQMLWALFVPWFTDMGSREFEQLYLENFS